jgi:photosystem II stability/assembly factor-like uncharacterized protein
MRKQKLVLLLMVLVIASQNLFAQSGWQWAYPFPQGNNITQVKFYNANTGYAVGDLCLLKTTNGGTNWIMQGAPGTSYKTLAVLDSVTVIAARDGVYKTTNGGTNWVTINSTLLFVSKLEFMNSSTGFAITSNGLFRTGNGGVNWIQFDSGSSRSYNGIVCTSINTAYVIGRYPTGVAQYNAFVMKTSDYGETWSECYSTPSFMSQHISFVNSNTGYVIIGFNPDFRMLKTTNGGLNWSNTALVNCPEFINIKFFAGGIGYGAGAGTTPTTMGRTTNEGQTWSFTPIEMDAGFLDFLNLDTGYIAGTNGNILKTVNGGINFVNQTAPYGNNSKLNKVKFIDENTGYIIGEKGFLIKTTNLGNSWTFSRLSSRELRSLYFKNNWGYIGTDSNKIFRTNNSGLSWDTVAIPSPYQGIISSIHFLDYNTGFVTIAQNILKTTTAGNSWELSQTFINMVYSVQFTDDLLTGFAYYNANSNTYIQKTTNGGTNWTTSFISLNRSSADMKFADQNTGYITGPNILKTTNGGFNWFVCCNFGGQSIGVVSNTVYTVGAKSTDSGVNWFTQSIPYQYPYVYLKDIQFVNANTGIIVGGTSGNTVIFKTTDGGGFVSPLNVAFNTITSDNFNLHQNYPNPFNPSTKINYELRNTNYVSLKVFDLLGKEVATLVNEKQNAGSYAVDFNSTEFSLPSGIYFYTLNAGEFKETKKMVLLK